MKRDALGAIDHRGREILIAQPYDPLRKLPAERCHTCLHYAAEVLPLVAQMPTQAVYTDGIPKNTRLMPGVLCVAQHNSFI